MACAEKLLDPEDLVFNAWSFDNTSLPHKNALLKPRVSRIRCLEPRCCAEVLLIKVRLELTRFGGHPMVGAERSVHDAEEPSAVPGGVPTAHHRTGAEG